MIHAVAVPVRLGRVRVAGRAEGAAAIATVRTYQSPERVLPQRCCPAHARGDERSPVAKHPP